MADIEITQAEADALIAMEKRFVDEDDWTFPPPGQRMALALTTPDKRPCPHLHIYREGYGVKWAVPIPIDRYRNPADLFSTCEAFLQHCNITGPAKMRKGLFS